MSLRLRRGDLLPRILVPPPGPRARALCRRLEELEARAANTLHAGEATILWEEARGANVLDVDGNRYLDLTAGFGVAAVGHRHPDVVAAVRRQAGRLLHGLGDVAAHPLRVALAARLGEIAPLADPRVYFAISGADAVEIALKTALLASGRQDIVALRPGYHGTTLGALAASSRPAFREPFASHLSPHVTHLQRDAPLEEVEALLARLRPAALLAEPIAGREGVLLPEPGWLAGLARCCRRHGVLLVLDEIFTGLGRTGEWFACSREQAEPDLLCCGKALGGGLPIAAVVGRRQLLDAWPDAGEALHTATFVAHPVACAAALATLRVLDAERLPARAGRLGDAVRRRLDRWPTRFPVLREVRGRGLLWGLELISARAAAELVLRARARGVLVLAGGASGTVVQLTPPLTITERQLDWALERLEEELARLS